MVRDDGIGDRVLLAGGRLGHIVAEQYETDV